MTNKLTALFKFRRPTTKASARRRMRMASQLVWMIVLGLGVYLTTPSTAAAAVSGTAILNSISPALLQTIPPGSYKQSCSQIKVEGNRLSAYCKDSEGSEHLTVLSQYQFCIGDIWNDQGNLTCKKPKKDLAVRNALYYLGGKTGTAKEASKIINKNEILHISTNEAEGCNSGFCTFYFGIYVERIPGKGNLSPYARITTNLSGASYGQNVFFTSGQTAKSIVYPLSLKVGTNKLEVEVDPNDEVTEDSNNNNHVTFTVVVK